MAVIKNEKDNVKKSYLAFWSFLLLLCFDIPAITTVDSFAIAPTTSFLRRRTTGNTT